MSPFQPRLMVTLRQCRNCYSPSNPGEDNHTGTIIEVVSDGHPDFTPKDIVAAADFTFLMKLSSCKYVGCLPLQVLQECP